jgi:outer membrane protein OmpA-like peptidoglycan-associated protein
MKSLTAVATLLIFASAVLAAEAEDHPLITRYPGSSLSRKDVKDFDEYNLVTGYDAEKNQPTGQKVQGKVSRMGYYHPKERSVLEVFKNYEDALKKAGVEILFSCAESECGPSFAGSAWNRFNGVTTKTPDSRFLSGKLERDGKTAYIAIMVGTHRHDIHIVEVEEMDTGLVTVDAKVLGQAIERDGFVSIYGIHFDFNKSDTKPESAPALREISTLLKERPELNIYVVGHTDNVGSLEFNMQLAEARAKAVADELNRNYGVDRNRVEPHGVGPLVPRTTNGTDAGRAKNRRVELVAK